jgi:hypothetical protein
MTVDFQQVQQQIRQLGENAPYREEQRRRDLEQALTILADNAQEIERMQQKVREARSYDPTLRCALPVSEALDSSLPLPPLPASAVILAADGSQIAADRTSEVSYCLVNVGAIQYPLNSTEAPQVIVRSRLMYDEQIYNDSGMMTDAQLALARDLAEREILAELAENIQAPVISFTDGPMELWGAKDSDSPSDFQEKLAAYQDCLERLCESGAATAGYVDKPSASMVVRLLEVLLTPQDQLSEIKKSRPLRSVSDRDLYRRRLGPGERSAVFAIHSKSTGSYRGRLSLHFFYLNVSLNPEKPWLARVEVPAWVVEDPEKLNQLHAVLVSQSRLMGSRPYPYALHRAHETAVVSMQEKEQITQMVILELRRRGIEVSEISYKQAAKSLGGRTRY